MARKRTGDSERARQVVAQEAARLIIDHGIRDYRVAKQKAAERLGGVGRGSLPGNTEIEAAVADHLQIFNGEEHNDLLRLMRTAALSAMELLNDFSPRLVGPVLAGTADENSAVNLHVFADSPEMVAMGIGDMGIPFRSYERRLKTRRGQVETYAGFEFNHQNEMIQATVFPIDGIRQAPMSPIDSKPMKRADKDAVQELLEHV
jgi:predicted nucleotidyltransferase